MLASPINLRSGNRSEVKTFFLGFGNVPQVEKNPFAAISALAARDKQRHAPINPQADMERFEAEFLAEFADLLPMQSESAGKPIFNGFKVAASEKKAKIADSKPLETTHAPVHIAEDGTFWHYGFQSKTKAGMYRHLVSEGRTHAFFTQDGKPNSKVAIIPKKYRS